MLGRKAYGSFRILVLAIFLAYPAAAVAQVLYGSIVGNVADSTGAVVPGAAVTITHRDTNQTRTAMTNEAGGYSFPTIQTGAYDVKVTKDGFRPFSRAGIPVTINNVTRADITLEVGAVTETVTVTAAAPLLQSDTAEVRAELGTRALENLPVPLGRNYQQLFRTLAGFTPPANAHSIPTNPSRALRFNVNGASDASNNTRIDGASSTVIQLPWIVAYIPSLEAIETVNVVTNSFDAEQGLAGGAAISLQTRSGTNDMHGALYEYHSNQRLKAKPFFLPVGERKPKLVSNQFGAALGGPIKRDKLFYFMAYEGTTDRQLASLTNISVPTAAMKAGDMSVSARQVFDPLTGDAQGNNRVAFPGNIIPRDRIHPISRRLADLTPLPNLPGTANNYFVAAPFSFDRHTADTKVNYNVNQRFNTFVRFSILQYNSFNQEVFGPLGGPPIAGGNAGSSFGGTYSTTVAATYTASPNFIVDAYYGYTRMDTSSEQSRLDENLGRDFLGIPGTNGTRRFEGSWPTFSISNFTNIGTNHNFMPYYRRDPQYQYVTNFNWTGGKHNIRFGFDLYRQHLNQSQAEFVGGGGVHGGQGGFTFAGGPTITRGVTANNYNSYATFLLGLPTTIGRILQVPDEYNLRAWLHSFYLRDRWNVTPKLTVSYGLRWEYFPFPTRSDRGMEVYDPNINKVLVCGVGSVPDDCNVEVSKRHFAPRLGLAYRATNSLVFRAGYGITNDPFMATEFMRAEYPVLIPLVITGPNSFQPAGRLENGIPTIPVPNLGDGVIDIPSAAGFAGWPQKIRRGYIQSWNLTLQKQLPYGFAGEVAYVASRETKKLSYFDINSGQIIGAGQAGQPLFQRFGRTAPTTFVMPTGTGQYNALQAKLERRFSGGLQLTTAYTWSKSIGIVNNTADQPPIRAYDYMHLARAVRGFDRTHNVHVSSVWEVPFGRGKRWANSGVASAVLGGWQVNNIVALISGTPFSVSADGASLNLPGSTQRADQVKPKVQKLGGAGPRQSFFDPLAFAPVAEPRFGTAGYNSLRGPGIVNWDFGIFREFTVTERWRVQFRAESFNFTNTPHFGNPGGNVSAASIRDGVVSDLGSYTVISSTTNLAREGIDERQFRFGIRIGF